METSLVNFRNNMVEAIVRIQWGQWSALGVFAENAPHVSTLIDPEALICSTMFFGRSSARIFDESMDWIATNCSLISVDRLKTIAAMHNPETRAALGAVLDYMWRVEGIVKFKGKADRWAGDISGERVPLFRNETFGGKKNAEKLDDTFYSWGFMRKSMKLRKISRTPDLSNPANLRMKLKHIFGIGAKSEVVAYLLLKGEGNSNEIADAVSQNQRAVYSTLNELVASGVVSRIDAGRKSIYATQRERWREFLGADEYPHYLQWAYIFSGLEQINADFETNPELYENPYLASSRFREITPALARRFHIGGVKTPPPKTTDFPGEEYNKAFIIYIESVIKDLIDSSR